MGSIHSQRVSAAVRPGPGRPRRRAVRAPDHGLEGRADARRIAHHRGRPLVGGELAAPADQPVDPFGAGAPPRSPAATAATVMTATPASTVSCRLMCTSSWASTPSSSTRVSAWSRPEVTTSVADCAGPGRRPWRWAPGCRRRRWPGAAAPWWRRARRPGCAGGGARPPRWAGHRPTAGPAPGRVRQTTGDQTDGHHHEQRDGHDRAGPPRRAPRPTTTPTTSPGTGTDRSGPPPVGADGRGLLAASSPLRSTGAATGGRPAASVARWPAPCRPTGPVRPDLPTAGRWPPPTRRPPLPDRPATRCGRRRPPLADPPLPPPLDRLPPPPRLPAAGCRAGPVPAPPRLRLDDRPSRPRPLPGRTLPARRPPPAGVRLGGPGRREESSWSEQCTAAHGPGPTTTAAVAGPRTGRPAGPSTTAAGPSAGPASSQVAPGRSAPARGPAGSLGQHARRGLGQGLGVARGHQHGVPPAASR